MKILLLILISFIITYFITPLVILLATRFNAIDNPGKRRFHRKATPRWGGAAIFIGVIPVLFFLEIDKSLVSFLAASVILIALGLADDQKSLGWRIKFGGMAAVTSIVIFFGDAVISYVGSYGHFGQIHLGIFSIPFTYFGVIGVTNAMNLMDGLNGLAGGVSLVAFLIMGIAASIVGYDSMAMLCYAYAGSLAGFLQYNFPKAKIFMGDSGSLFLGFSLAVVSVLLTQNRRYSVPPMFPVFVLLIPIFDTLRVMFLRIFNLKNPFKADKTHLHHLIVRRRFSSTGAVVFIWAVTAAFGVVALMLIKKTSTPYMILALYISLIMSFFTDAIARRR